MIKCAADVAHCQFPDSEMRASSVCVLKYSIGHKWVEDNAEAEQTHVRPKPG